MKEGKGTVEGQTCGQACTRGRVCSVALERAEECSLEQAEESSLRQAEDSSLEQAE